jgi:hypothetical protein
MIIDEIDKKNNKINKLLLPAIVIFLSLSPYKYFCCVLGSVWPSIFLAFYSFKNEKLGQTHI